MHPTPTPQINNVLAVDPSKNVTGERVYQVWKGNNMFFLGGRLIFGPDARSLLLTIFLIVVPAAIFCVYVASKLMKDFPHHIGIAIMVVAVVHTVGVLILLLLTSSRDPGIVPRNRHPPEPEEDFDISNQPADWAGEQTPRLRLPRTKDVVVNGVAVKTKYCDTCMLYRPPRCSHCSICNNCVDRFDHHCPWVGQCIGRRNYRFFFMFVSTATILCMYVFAMSALLIKKVMEEPTPHTVLRALRMSPAAIFLMIYSFIAMWFVGGLTVFHFYLMSSNQTTYENFRYRYDNKPNPYDRGIMHNFKEIFCTSIPASKHKFRARVEEEQDLSGYSVPPGKVGSYLSQNNRKDSSDIELGGKPGWTSIVGREVVQERNSLGGDMSKEMNDGYENSFAQALGLPLPLPYEGDDMRNKVHPRQSNWGRKSGNWEIAPEMATLATGIGGEGSRVKGDSTPPGNR